MQLSDLIDFCLAFPHAEESMPFGPEHLVYKVKGKVFAITSPDEFPISVNLKCDPERSIELREKHEAITPGYHMNKRHWNTVVLNGTVPDELVKELVQHSYDLVCKKNKR